MCAVIVRQNNLLIKETRQNACFHRVIAIHDLYIRPALSTLSSHTSRPFVIFHDKSVHVYLCIEKDLSK